MIVNSCYFVVVVVGGVIFFFVFVYAFPSLGFAGMNLLIACIFMGVVGFLGLEFLFYYLL